LLRWLRWLLLTGYSSRLRLVTFCLRFTLLGCPGWLRSHVVIYTVTHARCGYTRLVVWLLRLRLRFGWLRLPVVVAVTFTVRSFILRLRSSLHAVTRLHTRLPVTFVHTHRLVTHTRLRCLRYTHVYGWLRCYVVHGLRLHISPHMVYIRSVGWLLRLRYVWLRWLRLRCWLRLVGYVPTFVVGYLHLRLRLVVTVVWLLRYVYTVVRLLRSRYVILVYVCCLRYVYVCVCYVYLFYVARLFCVAGLRLLRITPRYAFADFAFTFTLRLPVTTFALVCVGWVTFTVTVCVTFYVRLVRFGSRWVTFTFTGCYGLRLHTGYVYRFDFGYFGLFHTTHTRSLRLHVHVYVGYAHARAVTVVGLHARLVIYHGYTVWLVPRYTRFYVPHFHTRLHVTVTVPVCYGYTHYVHTRLRCTVWFGYARLRCGLRFYRLRLRLVPVGCCTFIWMPTFVYVLFTPVTFTTRFTFGYRLPVTYTFAVVFLPVTFTRSVVGWLHVPAHTRGCYTVTFYVYTLHGWLRLRFAGYVYAFPVWLRLRCCGYTFTLLRLRLVTTFTFYVRLHGCYARVPGLVTRGYGCLHVWLRLHVTVTVTLPFVTFAFTRLRLRALRYVWLRLRLLFTVWFPFTLILVVRLRTFTAHVCVTRLVGYVVTRFRTHTRGYVCSCGWLHVGYRTRLFTHAPRVVVAVTRWLLPILRFVGSGYGWLVYTRFPVWLRTHHTLVALRLRYVTPARLHGLRFTAFTYARDYTRTHALRTRFVTGCYAFTFYGLRTFGFYRLPRTLNDYLIMIILHSYSVQLLFLPTVWSTILLYLIRFSLFYN